MRRDREGGSKLTVLVLDQVRDHIADESFRAGAAPLESNEIADDLLVLDVESLNVVVHGGLSKEGRDRFSSSRLFRLSLHVVHRRTHLRLLEGVDLVLKSMESCWIDDGGLMDRDQSDLRRRLSRVRRVDLR